MSSKIFLIAFLFTFQVLAGNSPAVDIRQGGNPISNTNPLGVRLSDGTNYLTNLPVTANIGTTNGLALEAGHAASMDATLALIKAKTDNIDVALSTRTKPADAQNVTVSGTPNVAVTSSVLPTAAATSAAQATGNASVASIDTKTPALGQALAASSVPVVLPAAQITTLTPPTTVTVTQATGTNLHTVIDSGAVTATISGTPTVTANIGTTNGLALDSTVAKDSSLSTLNTSVGTVNTSVNTLLKPASTLAAVTTVGSVTSITNPVAVTGAFFQGTQPISASTLPLPTGAATETTLSALNTSQTNGTQKSQIVNAAGNTIASIDDGNGGKALEVAQGATSFVFSTVNSTTAQLAAAATFAGAVETVTNQQSASVILTSDQNGTLTTIEYIDAGGTRISRQASFAITAGVPFSRSFVLNGNYYKNTFTNTGASTTTTLNLNTAYGTIPSATALGNGQVSIDEVNGTAISLGAKTTALSFPVVQAADQTYAAASAPFAVAATPTDIFTITGSATKTIQVTKLALNCTQTTAGEINVLVIKRSTANTAGTAVAATVVSVDSANAAGTATVNAYTANPTLGTTVGNIRARKMFVPGVASAAEIAKGELLDPPYNSQLLTLRGTTQVLAINLNSTTLTGGNCVAYAEWTEK
jgi:hypothetical protein